MEFGVLGPLLVRGEAGPVEIGARKQRALLIHLLLRVGETVPVDKLIDALWDEDPPPQARVTLRSYVSNLRRVLESAGEGQLIATRGNGYAVDISPEAVDAVRFERMLMVARQAGERGDPAGALGALDGALALWRGEALADVANSPFAVGERTRLEELRLSAQEDRFDVLLTLARHAEAVAGLEAFIARAPLRERPHGQLMVALYRSGRSADALAVFRRYRETLADELGLDPGSELQQLADRILRQDEDLNVPQPQVAGAIQGPSSSRARTGPTTPADRFSTGDPDESRLVGRTHERAELRAAVERVRRGAGGLLLVAGESGIGKSTLLDGLARIAGAAGLQVQWGRCHETKGAPAFWPWIQVLRSIADAVDDDALERLVAPPARPVGLLVEQVADRIGPYAPDASEDMETARFRVYDAVAAFLLRACEQTPLVVVLDDLHWADNPTLETLAFVAPVLGSSNLLIAAAYRDTSAEWVEGLEATIATVVREPWTQQVALMGLQPDDVAALAEQTTGEPLGADERDLLQRRTGGNPFFVRQLSQLLAETDGAAAAEQIPSAVRHVITRRLAMLSVTVRELLEAASVMGGQFDVRLLATVTDLDMDETFEAVAIAVRHGLLEAVGRSATSYRFVHALVRETIYDSLTPVHAARLHARVGTALESTPNASVYELAAHFWRAAEVVEDERPVRYLRAAAEEAIGVLAFEQAEDYLRKTLELLAQRPESPRDELEVRLQLVQLLSGIPHGWFSPRISEVAAPAEQSARAMVEQPDLLPLWHGLFTIRIAQGDTDSARVMTDQLLAEGHASGHAAVMATAAVAAAQLSSSMGGDLSRSSALAREAQARLAAGIKEHPEAGIEPLQLNASWVLTAGLAYDGDKDATLKAARACIALAERIGGGLELGTSYMVAGIMALIIDEPAFALECADKGAALCERHHFEIMGALFVVLGGCGRARLGEDAMVQALHMDAAIEVMLERGFLEVIAKAMLFTAETFALAGDDVSARNWLERARTHQSTYREMVYPRQIQRIEALLAASPS